ncbi:MAG: hypothetical protein POH28_10095 [Acidocella sp.]|nr:hypothetical protein [Acidocella sp.]
MNNMITTQAQIIAYVDDYKFLLYTSIPAMACLLLMRSPPRGSTGAAADGQSTEPLHAAMD